MKKQFPINNQNHYHGWIDGCLDDKQPSDGFDYGALLTETVQLANIAIRFPKKKLRWDAENMKFSNNDEANKWVSREYREGWDLTKMV